MNQKQRKTIAKMWCGAVILASPGDAFDPDISEDDISKILEECDKIGYKLLDKNPLLNTLPEIIQWVKANK